MIHFYDTYVISDFFCSLVLILLHETTCCDKVTHQLYKMSFLVFTANQNSLDCTCRLKSVKSNQEKSLPGTYNFLLAISS